MGPAGGPPGDGVCELVLLDERLRADESLRPRRATEGSVAYDLRACLDEPVQIDPGEVVEIGTGVAVHINDPSYCGLVAPRSGLGVKKGVALANMLGVIDADYTGELRCGTWNRSNKPFTIEPYERFMQLLFVRLWRPTLKLVDSFSEKSARGADGFGSTGSS